MGMAMGGWEWMLDLIVAALLLATLFHARRLERALGVLKRDRAALQELVSSFNASTLQAEAGIARLHAASDGAGRQIARQTEASAALKDDLSFLTERGERLADRLEQLVRAARPLVAEAPRAAEPELAGVPGNRMRSQAERDLMKALRLAR